MDASRSSRRTRLAVFGSLAAERAGGDDVATARVSPAVGAVLEAVLAAIAQRAPSIAAPILDRAVDEGRITRVERHELLQTISAGDGEVPRAVVLSADGRQVLREALAAVRRETPAIAGPILDVAVAGERLTAAQQQRILERLRTSPAATALATPAAP